MSRNNYALSTKVIKGSVLDIVTSEGMSVAEALLDVKIVAIVDTSGTMSIRDTDGGESRYRRACNELEKIQASNPGQVLVISFSTHAEVCMNGVPYNFDEGTKVAAGLEKAKEYDIPGIQFVLICDGHPDDPYDAMKVARMFKNPINTIFIGDETDRSARDWLLDLAKASGGQAFKDVGVKLLKENVETLLLTSGK